MTDDHVIWDTQLGKNTVNSVGHDKGTPSILILFMWPLKVLDSEKNSCFCSVTLLIGCIHTPV